MLKVAAILVTTVLQASPNASTYTTTQIFIVIEVTEATFNESPQLIYSSGSHPKNPILHNTPQEKIHWG
jgi:hypothetical protein